MRGMHAARVLMLDVCFGVIVWHFAGVNLVNLVLLEFAGYRLKTILFLFPR